MKKWAKLRNPNSAFDAVYVLGDREIELFPGEVISVTRVEGFSLFRMLLNDILNRFVMKAMITNKDLRYAEVAGRRADGISQTVTIWKSGRRMNQFRQNGLHQAARKIFRWVFYSGNVQAYFLTWKYEGPLPPTEEITAFVKTYGRHFDGGKLTRKGSIPVNRKSEG